MIFNFNNTKIPRIPCIPVLGYHHVHDKQETFFRVTPSVLRAQMEFLLAEGYTAIHPDRLIEAKAGSIPVEKPVLVTFDDGYEDFFQYAWPILEELGIRVLLFLISGFIGRWNEWDESSPSMHRQMDVVQLKELLAAGVVFGSHSCSHRQLTQLGKKERLVEIRDSKKELEDMFGVPIRTFAYPGGHVNRAVRDTVSHYYELGFAVSTGKCGDTCDPYMIERFDPGFCIDIDDFKTNLKNRKQDKSYP
jgi:peptidoglycan/xylan/chitin deacetylase (PgdA/CDA1 family)